MCILIHCMFDNTTFFNRSMVCEIHRQRPELRPLTCTCGMPEGSMLGPSLFWIYFNDFEKCQHHSKLSTIQTILLSTHPERNVLRLNRTYLEIYKRLPNFSPEMNFSLNQGPVHTIPFLNKNATVKLRFWLCVHISLPQKRNQIKTMIKTELNKNATL